MEELKRIIAKAHKNLECPICLDVLEDPYSTPCNHKFCRKCIDHLLSRKCSKGGTACPLCKSKISKRGLSQNGKLVDVVKAVRNVLSAINEDTGTPTGNNAPMKGHQNEVSEETPFQRSKILKDINSKRPLDTLENVDHEEQVNVSRNNTRESRKLRWSDGKNGETSKASNGELLEILDNSSLGKRQMKSVNSRTTRNKNLMKNSNPIEQIQKKSPNEDSKLRDIGLMSMQSTAAMASMPEQVNDSSKIADNGVEFDDAAMTPKGAFVEDLADNETTGFIDNVVRKESGIVKSIIAETPLLPFQNEANEKEVTEIIPFKSKINKMQATKKSSPFSEADVKAKVPLQPRSPSGFDFVDEDPYDQSDLCERVKRRANKNQSSFQDKKLKKPLRETHGVNSEKDETFPTRKLKDKSDSLGKENVIESVKRKDINESNYTKYSTVDDERPARKNKIREGELKGRKGNRKSSRANKVELLDEAWQNVDDRKDGSQMIESDQTDVFCAGTAQEKSMEIRSKGEMEMVSSENPDVVEIKSKSVVLPSSPEIDIIKRCVNDVNQQREECGPLPLSVKEKLDEKLRKSQENETIPPSAPSPSASVCNVINPMASPLYKDQTKSKDVTEDEVLSKVAVINVTGDTENDLNYVDGVGSESQEVYFSKNDRKVSPTQIEVVEAFQGIEPEIVSDPFDAIDGHIAELNDAVDRKGKTGASNGQTNEERDAALALCDKKSSLDLYSTSDHVKLHEQSRKTENDVKEASCSRNDVRLDNKLTQFANNKSDVTEVDEPNDDADVANENVKAKTVGNESNDGTETKKKMEVEVELKSDGKISQSPSSVLIKIPDSEICVQEKICRVRALGDEGILSKNAANDVAAMDVDNYEGLVAYVDKMNELTDQTQAISGNLFSQESTDVYKSIGKRNEIYSSEVNMRKQSGTNGETEYTEENLNEAPISILADGKTAMESKQNNEREENLMKGIDVFGYEEQGGRSKVDAIVQDAFDCDAVITSVKSCQTEEIDFEPKIHQVAEKKSSDLMKDGRFCQGCRRNLKKVRGDIFELVKKNISDAVFRKRSDLLKTNSIGKQKSRNYSLHFKAEGSLLKSREEKSCNSNENDALGIRINRLSFIPVWISKMISNRDSDEIENGELSDESPEKRKSRRKNGNNRRKAANYLKKKAKKNALKGRGKRQQKNDIEEELSSHIDHPALSVCLEENSNDVEEESSSQVGQLVSRACLEGKSKVDFDEECRGLLEKESKNKNHEDRSCTISARIEDENTQHNSQIQIVPPTPPSQLPNERSSLTSRSVLSRTLRKERNLEGRQCLSADEDENEHAFLSTDKAKQVSEDFSLSSSILGVASGKESQNLLLKEKGTIGTMTKGETCDSEIININSSFVEKNNSSSHSIEGSSLQNIEYLKGNGKNHFVRMSLKRKASRGQKKQLEETKKCKLELNEAAPGPPDATHDNNIALKGSGTQNSKTSSQQFSGLLADSLTEISSQILQEARNDLDLDQTNIGTIGETEMAALLEKSEKEVTLEAENTNRHEASFVVTERRIDMTFDDSQANELLNMQESHKQFELNECEALVSRGDLHKKEQISTQDGSLKRESLCQVISGSLFADDIDQDIECAFLNESLTCEDQRPIEAEIEQLKNNRSKAGALIEGGDSIFNDEDQLNDDILGMETDQRQNSNIEDGNKEGPIIPKQTEHDDFKHDTCVDDDEIDLFASDCEDVEENAALEEEVADRTNLDLLFTQEENPFDAKDMENTKNVPTTDFKSLVKRISKESYEKTEREGSSENDEDEDDHVFLKPAFDVSNPVGKTSGKRELPKSPEQLSRHPIEEEQDESSPPSPTPPPRIKRKRTSPRIHEALAVVEKLVSSKSDSRDEFADIHENKKPRNSELEVIKDDKVSCAPDLRKGLRENMRKESANGTGKSPKSIDEMSEKHSKINEKYSREHSTVREEIEIRTPRSRYSNDPTIREERENAQNSLARDNRHSLKERLQNRFDKEEASFKKEIVTTPKIKSEDQLKENRGNNIQRDSDESLISRRKQPRIFVPSRLNKKQMSYCKLLADKINCKFSTSYVNGLSHLIMGTEENSAIDRSAYTYKYLMALITGSWIVSFKWVLACINAGKVIDESPFEVKGDPSSSQEMVPKQARLTRQRKESPLFSDLTLSLIGSFNASHMTKDQLVELLEKGGANVIFTLPDIVPSKNFLLITDSEDLNKEHKDQFFKANIQPVHYEWITESIINYKVQNPVEFLIGL